MKIRLVKKDNSLYAIDPDSQEWIDRKNEGAFFECDISLPRNYRFHCKAFALVTVAFNYWTPYEVSISTRKNFEKFREEITILAGYCKDVYKLDGSIELIADSWSFAKMDEESFKIFYDKILTVIIQKVLVGWSISEIDDEIGRFL